MKTEKNTKEIKIEIFEDDWEFLCTILEIKHPCSMAEVMSWFTYLYVANDLLGGDYPYKFENMDKQLLNEKLISEGLINGTSN